jgi:uncharacterized DUF497 family protein
MRFDWDPGNLEHIRKHGITRIEVEEALHQGEELVHVTTDVRNAEIRFLVLGLTKGRRLLSIVLIARGNNVRVVTARAASRKERKWYADYKADQHS